MSTVTISIEDALRLRRPALINAGTVEPNGTITAEALVRRQQTALTYLPRCLRKSAGWQSSGEKS
jgi:hypothetical protein